MRYSHIFIILIGFARDGKIAYVIHDHQWDEALIFDTNGGVGYKQELSNQTTGKFPDARLGANAILGRLCLSEGTPFC